MHVWFRQYAQQMGAQNTRAILPEQIDIVINTSITDIVNQLVREHIGLTSQQTIADGSKVGQINALLPLYKNVQFKVVTKPGNKFGMYLDYIKNYLFITSFALDYKDDNGVVTLPFNCRIIETGLLANTLNDFILKPRINSPILVAHDDVVEIYVGNNKRFTPNYLYIDYIAKPDVVKLGEDENSSVDCNLPEYLHVTILKHAVDLWMASIRGANTPSQQQVPQGQVTEGTQQVQ